MAGGAVIHKLAPLRCVAAGPLRSLMNNCETDIGAAQDLPEWAVFTVDSGRTFRAQSQGGDEVLGLRCAPAQATIFSTIGELNRRGETPPEKAALRGQDKYHCCRPLDHARVGNGPSQQREPRHQPLPIPTPTQDQAVETPSAPLQGLSPRRSRPNNGRSRGYYY